VLVAYLINSTVLTTAIVHAFWYVMIYFSSLVRIRIVLSFILAISRLV
jgi:hypothetical protein